VLRLAATTALLLLIGQSIDLGTVSDLFSGVQPRYLGIALALLLAVRLLMAIRWYCLLRAFAIEESFASVLSLFFMSSFLGLFLPGIIGADLIRGYQLMRTSGKTNEVAATLLLDRYVGVISLSVFAFGGVLLVADRTAAWWAPLLSFLVVGAGVLIGLALFADRIVRTLARWSDTTRKFRTLGARVLRLARMLTNREALLPVMPSILGLSFAVLTLRALVFYYLFRAFQAEASLIDCLAFVPVVFLVMMAPVSIGGLGVREGSLVILFTGVPREAAVSVGLASQFLQILASAPGAGLWLATRRSPKAGRRK
jgi:uncharacterized protein (TIRG00374 family)